MSELTILSPSEQVAEHLRGELLRGRWRGTLPGVPTLAAEFGVDHKAVASAIRLLERKGLLIGQHFVNNEVGYKVAAGLFKRKVLVAGTLINAKAIRFEPPLVVTQEEIDEVLNRLRDTLKEVA